MSRQQLLWGCGGALVPVVAVLVADLLLVAIAVLR